MARRVAISAISPGFQRQAGLFSFKRNLLRGFAELCEQDPAYQDVDLTLFHTPGVPIVEDDCWNFVPVSRILPIAASWDRFAQETRIAWKQSQEFDAMLFLDYFTPPFLQSPRNVTVIHDLLYYHMPEMMRTLKRGWLRHSHKKTLRRSSAVVSISEVVRQDIMDVYGSEYAGRVHAIWNPIDWHRYDDKTEHDFTEGRPFLMSVAVDRPQKNIATLIRAFHLIKDQFPEHQLVLVGQPRASITAGKRRYEKVADRFPSTVDLIRDLEIEDRVVVTGYIEDSQIGSLYRNAELFVMPSLFEGFGMPVVEALGLGTPVLTSGLPVLREVSLDSAYYLGDDPCDEAAMARQLTELLGQGRTVRPSADFIETIRSRFSPKTIAKQYMDLLLSA